MKGIQVSKRFLLLLLVPILFIGSQAASIEQSESSQTMAHPSDFIFLQFQRILMSIAKFLFFLILS